MENRTQTPSPCVTVPLRGLGDLLFQSGFAGKELGFSAVSAGSMPFWVPGPLDGFRLVSPGTLAVRRVWCPAKAGGQKE
jgi:hypothetical protein